MASPLKTLVLRYPSPAAAAAAGRTASIVRSSPKASFSTVRSACLARAPLRPQCLVASIPRAVAQKSTAASPETRAATGSATASGAQASPSSNPGDNAADSAHLPLDWDSFFKLRMKRRRVQVLFSVTGGLFSGGGGAVLLSTGLAEPIVSQVPLDPFATLGLMTLGFIGMGWLAGPSIGNQVFYAMNRKYKKQITQKEAEFFARIKKHRVDPTNSTAGNPVPDFYGEKIQSVKGYRQWLKDQKAFNKKKTAAVF